MKKVEIYDNISKVLTDYENEEATAEDLYNTLVEIQNKWEDIITVDTN